MSRKVKLSNKESLLSLMLTAAVVVVSPGADLSVHYRADAAGFTTNAAGQVTKIVNQGTLGSGGDLFSVNETPTVTVVANAFGTAPAFRFDGQDNFQSQESVSVYANGQLGLGGIYFVVSRSNLAGNNGRNRAPFAHGSSASRHGYFVGGNGFAPYFYNQLPTGNNAGGFLDDAYDTNPDLVTVGYCKGQSADSTYTISAWRKGRLVGSRSGCSAVNSTGKLVLGNFCSDITWTSPWNGDVAEVRFYTGGMTASEYFKVTCELAATYGLSVADGTTYNFPASLLSGFQNDPAAMGTLTGTLNAETPAASATSGALTAEALDAVEADDSLVYLGHDGADGATRKWLVAGTTGAKGAQLRLTFTGAAFAAIEHPVLAFRVSGTAAPSEAGLEPVVAGDTVTFTLPANWANGIYFVTSAEELANAGLAIWYRADAGVTTNASGKVTAWANKGELGAVFDLANTNAAAPAVTVVENAFGDRPALHFDRTDHLRSATKASLGTSGDLAMFVVLNERSSQLNYGVAGFSDPDDTETQNRFGLMSGAIADRGFYLRFFAFNRAGYIDHLPLVVGNQMASLSLFGNRAIMDYTGDGTLAQGTVWTRTSFDGVFSVGNFHECMNNQNDLDVAEVRVYATDLTSYRYERIRAELSAKYALPFNGVTGELFAGCAQGLAAFGDTPTRGSASSEPAAVADHATCGALTVRLGTTPVAVNDTFTAITSNGKSGTEGEWCVAAGADARSVPLVLTFTGTAFTASAGVRLYRKAASGWLPLPVTPVAEGETLTCTLPAEWESGRYRVCTEDDIVAADCGIWFRADKGVETDGSGKVTGWRNSGFLGGAYDVRHAKILADADAASTIQYETTCGTLNAQPAVRFVDGRGSSDKLQYLTTPSNVSHPFNPNGHTLFAVLEVEDKDRSESFFGFDDGGTHRFGLQSAPTWTPRCWAYCCYTIGTVNPHQRANDNANWQKRFVLSAVTSARSDLAAGWYSLAVGDNGQSQYGTAQVATTDPFAANGCKLTVGTFIGSWGSGLRGRIAEIRYYNRPLTILEISNIELELSARYGVPVATAGAADPALLATHDQERGLLGNEYRRGRLTETVTSWTDGTLTATIGAVTLDESASNTLAVVAHNGGAVSFSRLSASTKALERTYLVASQAVMPMVLRFATGLPENGETYQLAFKANGGTSFATLPLEGIQDGDDVVFDFPDGLAGGVYRLQTFKACGTTILLR